MNEIERKSMTKVWNGFSERIGKLNYEIIQVNEFDNSTRTRIANKLFDILGVVFKTYKDSIPDIGSNFCKDFRRDVLITETFLSMDDKISWKEDLKKIADIINQAPYNEVLDVIEYCCGWITSQIDTSMEKLIQEAFNGLFERECVGYRLISGKIIPITSEVENKEITDACQISFDGVRIQFQKALGFLANKKSPDYKNCIKESISAIESLCGIFVGTNKDTLGVALDKLSGQDIIHPALSKAIKKLYGYASDEGGIRHGEGEKESTVTFEEAKLIMVVCSAVANYLIVKLEK